MRRAAWRLVPWITSALVLSTGVRIGAYPGSASARMSTAPQASPLSAAYRVTLESCWTNPPFNGCSRGGGVRAGSKFLTLMATVTPRVKAPISMRVMGQKYHPSTGLIKLVKNCGQVSPCEADLQTSAQGLSAWNFWVNIVDGSGRNLLKTSPIQVAFIIDKPSHLELWVNGSYRTSKQDGLPQLYGVPLQLEVRWSGARLDGNYWVRISNGDAMNTKCVSAEACSKLGWLTCDTGTTCKRTDLRTQTDGRYHRGRIYYGEMFSNSDPDFRLSTDNPYVYVNWCDGTPSDPCK